MARLTRDERLALVRGHLLEHPRDILLSPSALVPKLKGYDATVRTCQRDLRDLREDYSDSQAQVVVNLLVVDAALEQCLSSDDSAATTLVAILRERRATLQYRDGLCSDDGATRTERWNAYEEERRRWPTKPEATER